MPTLETRNNSKWWYGRWHESGKTIVKNLDVEVEGERPTDHSPTGDRKYRQSRLAAEAKLNEIAQAIHVARTGHRLGTIPVSGIFDAWLTMPRRRTQLSPHLHRLRQGRLQPLRRIHVGTPSRSDRDARRQPRHGLGLPRLQARAASRAAPTTPHCRL